MSVPLDLQAYKKTLQARRSEIKNRLRHYPVGELRIYHYYKKGRRYTAYRVYTPTGYTTYSRKRDERVIMLFAEKRFWIEKDKLLAQNIRTVEELYHIELADVSIDGVLQHMDAEIGEMVFLAQDWAYDLPANPDLARRIIEWMALPSPQTRYRPEDLNKKTTSGYYVRSKSEVVLAEKLREYRLPFKYEYPIQIGGHEYLPDFTVMRKDGKLVYIEHCGLMNSEEYRKNFWQKMQAYALGGIVPWDNLIITYDDEDGNIDVNIIEAEIKSKILNEKSRFDAASIAM